MEEIKRVRIILAIFLVLYGILMLLKFFFGNCLFDGVSFLLLVLGVFQSNYFLLKIYPIANFFAIFDSLVTILTKLQREGGINFKEDKENLINFLSLVFYPFCCYAVFQGYKELKGIEYDRNKKNERSSFTYTEIAKKNQA